MTGEGARAARVELLFVEGCPGVSAVVAVLDRLAGELGFTWTPVSVESDEMAADLGFHGSPSVYVDGVDVFPDSTAAPGGLSCRLYPGAHGLGPAPEPRSLASALQGALRFRPKR